MLAFICFFNVEFQKFLSKLPGGIFGLENEQKLFDLYNINDPELQRQSFCRLLSSDYYFKAKKSIDRVR